MIPHPDTVCVLARMDHRQVLATAAQGRLAGDAVSTGDHRAVFSSAFARLRGALLGYASRRVGRLPVVPEGGPAPAMR